jgi:hypothetical protein
MNCSGSSGVDWTSQQNCGPIGSDPFTNKLLVPRGHPGGSTRSSATTEAGWLVANKRAAPAGVVSEFKRYSRRTLGSYRWQVQIASNCDNLLVAAPKTTNTFVVCNTAPGGQTTASTSVGEVALVDKVA